MPGRSPPIGQQRSFFANLNLKYAKVFKIKYAAAVEFEVLCEPVLLGISLGSVNAAFSIGIERKKSETLLSSYNHFDGNPVCQGFIAEELYFLYCTKMKTIFDDLSWQDFTCERFEIGSRIPWPDKPTLYRPAAFNYPHIDFLFCVGNELYAIQVIKQTPVQHKDSLNFWKRNNANYRGISHVESLFGDAINGKKMTMLWVIDSHDNSTTPPDPSVDEYDIGDDFSQIVARLDRSRNVISVTVSVNVAGHSSKQKRKKRAAVGRAARQRIT